MSIIFFSFTFLIIWWLVLFAVLPFGIDTANNVQKGNDSGAPNNPHIIPKFIITTIIALMLTIIGFWFIQAGYIDLREL